MVYECNNMVDYKPSEDDRRALQEYQQDKLIVKTKKKFSVSL